MESSVPVAAHAVEPAQGMTVSSRSLAAAFAGVEDPRRARGVTYPLAAVLTLAVAGILAQQCSVLAITEWGPAKPPRWCGPRGCRPAAPHASRRCNGAFASSMGRPPREP